MVGIDNSNNKYWSLPPVHILLKSGIAILAASLLGACNNSDKSNSAAPIPEKFTKAAYQTVSMQSLDQSERLTGTWIMLGQGSKATEEGSLVAGDVRLDESVYTQFNIREVVRINYDKITKSYSFTSCDGLGERELSIDSKQMAETTYGPSKMNMQLNLANKDYLQAEIKVSENFSETRLAEYNLSAKLYKLSPQDNFGNFTFQSEAVNPKWSQTLSQNNSFEAQCFSEVQGTFKRVDHSISAEKANHEITGELQTFGIEGPIATVLDENIKAANLYVEFSLHNDGKNPLQLTAASNIYAHELNNDAVWELAYDDWQTQFAADETPDIQLEYGATNSTHINASFKAAIGSDKAFSSNMKIKI